VTERFRTGDRRKDAARRRQLPGQQYVALVKRCSRGHRVVEFGRTTAPEHDHGLWTQPYAGEPDEYGKLHLTCPDCGERDLQVSIAKVTSALDEMWQPGRRAVRDLA
jgi:hypothetical protein